VSAEKGRAILRVHWKDACSSLSQEYLSGDDLVAFVNEDFLIESAGYLAGINDEALVLTGQIHPTNRVRGALRIPKSYIVEAEVLYKHDVEDSELSWLGEFLPKPPKTRSKTRRKAKRKR
jgi:hypothetical protein